MADSTRTRAPDAHAVSGRATAYWGWAFLVLLLVSAGMVTVPGGDDDVGFVRDFYTDHRTVVVTAQLIGLAAAAVLVLFARSLQGQPWVGQRPWVFISGTSVAAASVVTAMPPFVLCGVADSGSDDAVSALATASDLVDVPQFLTIALFGAVVASAVGTTWVRVLAGLVAVTSLVQALLLLLGETKTPLELVAPLAFVALVGCLSVLCWRHEARAEN
jgi:hypothetical protein